MSARILFVEDDPQVRSLLLTAVADTYEAEGVATAEDAIVCVNQSSFDIAVVDVALPQMSGIDLIPHLFRLCPNIVIIVISGNATIGMAVEAMKRGAIDFLTKPFDITDLMSLLKLAASRRAQEPAKATASVTRADHMVAHSATAQTVMSQATTIAPFNTTVLVTGETGTGKELL